MNIHKVVPDPQKWIQFYKSTLEGKQTRRIQSGRGGTLDPRRKSRRRNTYVQIPLVTPTEQSVQQAKAQVERRRHIKQSVEPKAHRSHLITKGNTSQKRKSSSKAKATGNKKKKTIKNYNFA